MIAACEGGHVCEALSNVTNPTCVPSCSAWLCNDDNAKACAAWQVESAHTFQGGEDNVTVVTQQWMESKFELCGCPISPTASPIAAGANWC